MIYNTNATFLQSPYLIIDNYYQLVLIRWSSSTIEQPTRRDPFASTAWDCDRCKWRRNWLSPTPWLSPPSYLFANWRWICLCGFVSVYVSCNLQVCESLEMTRYLPRELAKNGKISCSKKQLNKLIGELFVEQTEVDSLENTLTFTSMFLPFSRLICFRRFWTLLTSCGKTMSMCRLINTRGPTWRWTIEWRCWIVDWQSSESCWMSSPHRFLYSY